MLVSVDVGFSTTKICTDVNDGIVCNSIPTAVAFPSNSGVVGVGTEQFVIRFRDGNQLVAGEDAFDSEQQLENTSIDWLIRVMSTLVLTAVHKTSISMEQVSSLAVGLPIQFWKHEANKLKSLLSSIELEAKTYNPEVFVYAQGAGAFHFYRATMNPPLGERGLLIDLGGNTLQVLGYDGLKLKAALSKQYNHLGMLEPAKKLASKVATDHSISILIAKGMTILRSGTFGSPGDYQLQSQQLISNHMRLLLDRLEADLGERIMQAHRLVLAGGGAYHLIHQLPDAWKRKAILLPDAEYANAIGYLLQSRSLV